MSRIVMWCAVGDFKKTLLYLTNLKLFSNIYILSFKNAQYRSLWKLI